MLPDGPSLFGDWVPVTPDLGIFGKQMVDGDASSGGDLALVGTFFVVVLVGTFASQVRDYHTHLHLFTSF